MIKTKKILPVRITRYLMYVQLLVIFAVGAGPAPDNLRAEDRGGYAGSYLRLGLGARAKGMGGAFVGMYGDGYNAYYNPAGLPDVQSREVTYSYRSLSLDRKFYYVGFASKIPPTGGLAIGWIHAGIDDIDGRDFNGNHTQTYTDDQNGFLFAFGVKVLDNLNIGIGGTIVRESLVDIIAQGFGLNGGILYKPLQYLAFGASVRDAGAQYSWNSESLYERGSSTTDDFPTVYTAGASVNIERCDTIVVLDIFKNTKSNPGYRFGFENHSFDTFIIRGGLNDGEFTAGFGIRIPLVKSEGYLNYAFETSDNDLDSPQIISFSIVF